MSSVSFIGFGDGHANSVVVAKSWPQVLSGGWSASGRSLAHSARAVQPLCSGPRSSGARIRTFAARAVRTSVTWWPTATASTAHRALAGRQFGLARTLIIVVVMRRNRFNRQQQMFAGRRRPVRILFAFHYGDYGVAVCGLQPMIRLTTVAGCGTYS